MTIFWHGFIDFHCYHDSNCLSYYAKLGILLVNIWHFFIRKWCLPRCISNLKSTFSDTIKPINDKRLSIEILVIGYTSSVALVPGGHVQFQFWFICFIPLLYSMTGLPPITTFFLYRSLYPILTDYNGVPIKP